MNLPLVYLLIPYLIIAFFGLLMFAFNFYHIAKFGLQSPKTTYVLGLYILAFVGVIIISLSIISQYNWLDNISINGIFNIQTANKQLF
ncbi:hypothetical protein COY25_04060, partial [Candidatus Uhrbacteria bacterium CG_4_10_14_0_2_um_filter_41_7]